MYGYAPAQATGLKSEANPSARGHFKRGWDISSRRLCVKTPPRLLPHPAACPELRQEEQKCFQTGRFSLSLRNPRLHPSLCCLYSTTPGHEVPTLTWCFSVTEILSNTGTEQAPEETSSWPCPSLWALRRGRPLFPICSEQDRPLLGHGPAPMRRKSLEDCKGRSQSPVASWSHWGPPACGQHPPMVTHNVPGHEVLVRNAHGRGVHLISASWVMPARSLLCGGEERWPPVMGTKVHAHPMRHDPIL